MKRFFLISSLIVFACTLSSQEIKNLSLIPPSPEMSTLGTYGGFGVDHYTGRANISIPIYEIKLPDFSLPISLSYNTGGHKVEDIASWVGLGWSLNAGGKIARTVYGSPDDQNQGYMLESTTYTAKEVIDHQNGLDKDYIIKSIADGWLDTEPDIFYFGFGDYSGNFFYNQERREVTVVPISNLKVDIDYFLNGTERHWKIIDERGTEYYFEAKEKNIFQTRCGFNESSPDNFTSGWFLTKIITPEQGVQIEFNYEPVIYQIEHGLTQQIRSSNGYDNAPCVTPETPVYCISTNQYIGHRLSNIEWNNKRIVFEANTERLDLPTDYRLDSIKIFENTSLAVATKIFHLDYRYNKNVSTHSHDEIRLKLISLTEIGLNGESKPPYRFKYNEEILLPGRFSNEQDIWGFYNGASTNTHLVPPLQNKSLSALDLGGANRNTNSQYVEADILERIEYPTGGYTEFEYENHTVSSVKAPSFSENDFRVFRGEHLDINDRIGTSETFESSVFSINDVAENGAYIKLRIDGIYNCDHCNPIGGSQTCAILTLESITNPSDGFPITCDLDRYFLPNGSYRLKANFEGHTDPNDYSEFVIQINWSEDQSPLGFNEYTIGGLRIKSIKDVSNLDVVTKLYDYTNDHERSSGRLLNLDGIFERHRFCYDAINEREAQFVERSANSLIPLSTKSSPVVYEQVSVTNSSQYEAGKTTYKYSFINDAESTWEIAGDLYVYMIPPQLNMSYGRGLLLERKTYRNNTSNELQMLSHETIEYTHEGNLLLGDGDITYLGDSLDFSGAYAVRADKPLPGTSYFADNLAYMVSSAFVKPKIEILRRYENGKELTTKTSYYYDNPKHRLPTRIITSRSDGLDNIRYVTYPEDLSIPENYNDPYVAGIDSLQEKHILSQPIEIVNKLFDPADSSEQSLSASIQLFSPNSTGNVSVKSLNKSSSFQPITFDSNGNLVWDAAYETEIDILRENGTGRVLQTTTKDGVITSYVWGYDKQVIIGVITGVDYQTLIKPPFDLNIHTSYYDVYIEEFMDDWREEFPEAQITSYTYTDDLKITSQTDSNGRKTTYEYDDLRRLKMVRNHQGHIIRSFDYFYKN